VEGGGSSRVPELWEAMGDAVEAANELAHGKGGKANEADKGRPSND
jgi:hypothetical protein